MLLRCIAVSVFFFGWVTHSDAGWSDRVKEWCSTGIAKLRGGGLPATVVDPDSGEVDLEAKIHFFNATHPQFDHLKDIATEEVLDQLHRMTEAVLHIAAPQPGDLVRAREVATQTLTEQKDLSPEVVSALQNYIRALDKGVENSFLFHQARSKQSNIGAPYSVSSLLQLVRVPAFAEKAAVAAIAARKGNLTTAQRTDEEVVTTADRLAEEIQNLKDSPESRALAKAQALLEAHIAKSHLRRSAPKPTFEARRGRSETTGTKLVAANADGNFETSLPPVRFAVLPNGKKVELQWDPAAMEFHFKQEGGRTSTFKLRELVAEHLKVSKSSQTVDEALEEVGCTAANCAKARFHVGRDAERNAEVVVLRLGLGGQFPLDPATGRIFDQKQMKRMAEKRFVFDMDDGSELSFSDFGDAYGMSFQGGSWMEGLDIEMNVSMGDPSGALPRGSVVGLSNDYSLFGVDKDTPTEEISRRYRALAVRYHPDRNPDDKDAKAKFDMASQAHERILKARGQR